ncbi:hypothetical protein PsorP6_011364 [Peronosclerospora sorghi]|uniref:Uncharacterized protein n=1 Tax=Peronosclerospora sorghi TaxID=230839 RepID=A0ACC0WHZ2_9STRA|nr:hypothetical protein PsorP6_011364 [Peronosclerospora sorghi]
MLHGPVVRRVGSVRRASTRPNWLEQNCGPVPVCPQVHDAETSDMMRAGHALQVASATLLDAKAQCGTIHSTCLSEFHVLTPDTSAETEKVKELQGTQHEAVERIEEAVRTHDVRFRPSCVMPAVKLSSFALVGDSRSSTSFMTGTKMGLSEFYNDQIRELYARNRDAVACKELLKALRDQEQAFVDTHAPDMATATKNGFDPVATAAKMAVQVLARVAKAL